MKRAPAEAAKNTKTVTDGVYKRDFNFIKMQNSSKVDYLLRMCSNVMILQGCEKIKLFS